ncbi:MAG TPA: uroporphyrinogen-III synthase [Chloroflexota bacterium]
MARNGPLTGTSVLLTRGEKEDQPVRQKLEQLGASVREMPLIRIESPPTWDDADHALFRLHEYDWIVFTSRNAVRAVFDRLSALMLPPKLPAGMRVGAVGDATARILQTRETGVDCRPAREDAVSLAEAMISRGVKDCRVLLPAGDLARPELRECLQGAGALVDVIVVYRTVAVPADSRTIDELRRDSIDVVVLASPSAIRNLAAMLNHDVSPLRRRRVVCIGPTTARAVRDLGIEPAAVAERPTPEGLARAILQLRSSETRDD